MSLPNLARGMHALADDLDFLSRQPTRETPANLFAHDALRLSELREFLALLGYDELTCVIRTSREDLPHITLELRQDQAPEYSGD